MSMYNLLEYSKNYRKTTGSLYNYYRDELSDLSNNANVNYGTIRSNAFKYKIKIIGNTYNVDAADAGYDANKEGTQSVEIAIPLKYLGNFWRALNIPLISCYVSLELKWDKTRVVNAGPPVVRDNPPTGATFAIIIRTSSNSI